MLKMRCIHDPWRNMEVKHRQEGGHRRHIAGAQLVDEVPRHVALVEQDDGETRWHYAELVEERVELARVAAAHPQFEEKQAACSRQSGNR